MASGEDLTEQDLADIFGKHTANADSNDSPDDDDKK